MSYERYIRLRLRAHDGAAFARLELLMWGAWWRLARRPTPSERRAQDLREWLAAESARLSSASGLSKDPEGDIAHDRRLACRYGDYSVGSRDD